MKLGREKVNPLHLRVFNVAAWVALLLPIPVSAGEATGCAPEQRTLFSCSTGKKLLSVCGSRDLTVSSGYLHYQVRRADSLELSYPPADVDWRTGNLVQGGTWLFSGGGGAFMSFTNSPYRYVVYSATGRGWGSKAGAVVEKNGSRIASLKCKGKVISELGPDLFTQIRISEAAEFSLP